MINNDLNAELGAMQQIASVLIRLDPAARSRALHWIQKRFQDDSGPSVVLASPPRLALALTTDASPVSMPEPSADEALSVATLNDFFEARPNAVQTPSTAGLPRNFVAEFQDIAREWDTATHALPAAS